MEKKYSKILIIITLLFIMIFSFCAYQNSIHFSTQDEAMQHFLESIPNAQPPQLVEIVETNISEVYYLLMKSKGSSTIDTVSIVTIKKNIFGWKVTSSNARPTANLAKYLIDE